LRRASALASLLSALRGVDRLVLLGDLLELRQGPLREALAAAVPVLREIGSALGERAEVVIVPGNHDHHLAAAWLKQRAREAEPAPLGLESPLRWRPGESLGAVASALAPARVRGAYPGVWLRDDLYATHGHYCDWHTTVPMLERLGAATMAALVPEPPGGPSRAEDYERALAPMYALIHAIAQSPAANLALIKRAHGSSAPAWLALSAGARRPPSPRRHLTTAAFKALVGALDRTRLGPLDSELSGGQLRRAGLRALSEVIVRLEVPAAYVMFGHTHRAGPLGDEDQAEWVASTGAAIANTGCWVHDPDILRDAPTRSPYRPGFCAVVSEEGPPELGNLLDARR